ncbi:allantoicase [Pusillimonas sp. CC-YST705]|uniref:Probable allantoicase n=1 Tax=Mesopusillimonas faecipullorum TaxID=2755040 RepID=A0ABS8CA68_9BURK|nr:allantoicase [Mesopusillimonas faecipullorum]MCB5362915.1 allantoicase [Mesopusillimonas faecipullorum]
MVAPHLPDGTVLQSPVVELPAFAARYINLAAGDLGAKVLKCSDEFFGEARRMLATGGSVFIVGKFDDHGKWVDGWETQRRRHGGHDYAVVQLAWPGVIKGIDIDTSHFTGNYPQAASLEACFCEGEPDEHTQWVSLLPAQALSASAHHFIPLDDARVWSHVRLNIYPDGGVARFRVYGQPACDWQSMSTQTLHEVSSLRLGGRIVGYSDAHFGVPSRLLMSGRGVNMGDGWETRRRREPGFDWCVIELGHAVTVEKIEIDTAHFKGNYPAQVSLQAAQVSPSTDASVITQAMFWPELMRPQATQMHKQHFFEAEQLQTLGPVTHVRVNMYPDGGISRVRIWGRLAGV